MSNSMRVVATHTLHTLPLCNTLQHAATHCNTPQHSTHTLCHIVCVYLLHTIYTHSHPTTHCNTLHTLYTHSMRVVATHTLHTLPHCNTLQHTATHCNTLQHTATLYTHSMSHCMRVVATHTLHTLPLCNTLQHTATHYNTLQHTSRSCWVLRIRGTGFARSGWCSGFPSIFVTVNVALAIAVSKDRRRLYSSSCSVLQSFAMRRSMVQCGVVWCSVVWCSVVWCSVV